MHRSTNDHCGVRCDSAQYIDEKYICRITGKQCELGEIPNQWECYTHLKYNKNNNQ